MSIFPLHEQDGRTAFERLRNFFYPPLVNINLTLRKITAVKDSFRIRPLLSHQAVNAVVSRLMPQQTNPAALICYDGIDDESIGH